MTDKQLRKIIDWATSDDTGSSSIALCRQMLGLPTGKYGITAPFDSADRGRCIRLLNLIPEWWNRLDEMAKVSGITVTTFSKNGLKTEERGWKEQIPLIREERKQHEITA